MLQLKQHCAAAPHGAVLHLRLPRQTRSLLVYPSADAVIIVNAHSLSLVRVLAFSEAYPGTTRATGSLSCIAVDSSMALVLAAMDTRIAVWSLSGLQHDTWRIHSILTLQENQSIATVDCTAGLLAVGTGLGLSVYTLTLENDLPTWSQKWTVSFMSCRLKTPSNVQPSRITSPALIRFSPSLMYLATIFKPGNVVRLFSTATGRQMQTIPHPRPLVNLAWRHTRASSRDDLVLYTVTIDATIRIFLPVLDSPQHLQLHASLDLYSAVPSHVLPGHPDAMLSMAFWLDREIVGAVFSHLLAQGPNDHTASRRQVEEIKDESWDFFIRILWDGSAILTAIDNIDRRPPTLLKQFTLQQLPPSTFPDIPSCLYAVPNPDLSKVSLVTSLPLSVFELPLVLSSTPQSISLNRLHLLARLSEDVTEEDTEVVGMVRTPEGNGVAIKRLGGSGEVWKLTNHNSTLVRSGSWKSVDLVVVLQKGKTLATYCSGSGLLTLHSMPPQSLPVPAITTLLSLPPRGGRESLIGITNDFCIVHLHAAYDPVPTLTVHSRNQLPIASPKVILPVDPMAWGLSDNDTYTVHDVLLSISSAGELAFWVPEDVGKNGWRCTGKVKTGLTGIKKASCSSAKKTALVVIRPDADELTIWNSQESEFATGLEFRRTYSDPIQDLDWTSTPDTQSILAVGFTRRVELLCQQRLTYFDAGPGWSTCAIIDIENITPFHINDSIWLAKGSLLIAAGRQLLLYGTSLPPIDRGGEPAETLFEYAARHNGPLCDYHPQMVLQCLLWDKVELVKEIIVNLFRALSGARSKGSFEWQPLQVETFLRSATKTTYKSRHRERHACLFDDPDQEYKESDKGQFSRPLVDDLISRLESFPLPHLSTIEQAHLLTLIQTTLEIEEQRRALDSNGLRYLISMRSFYILNHRATSSNNPPSKGTIPQRTGHRERIRYRDMIWAFHSESQDLLLSASTAACKGGKMLWSDARALGAPIWLTSIETLKSQMEVIARNEYMQDDTRDPTNCSLFYFALGKVKLVQSLWRQAAWHKEQALTLKFLSNDFSEPRWRTAALKNAFALLSKRRFEYAVAFFLLGGSLTDAAGVCIRQLGDFQLAIALARVVEQSNEGPVLYNILRKTVLPTAFKQGNRWLGSWAFWLLHRRDLAVRILLTPLQDLATALDIRVSEIGEPHYDDPSLALLFSQLRTKTLQAAKGTSEISGRLEFNFVLQMARVFCRMGCHVLALDLVRSWTFGQPSMIAANAPEDRYTVKWSPSLTSPRRSVFDPGRRSSSIMIDMTITSLPSTRSPSPGREFNNIPGLDEELPQGDRDLLARKAGLGNLMKSAKQHVTVPEFDIDMFS